MPSQTLTSSPCRVTAIYVVNSASAPRSLILRDSASPATELARVPVPANPRGNAYLGGQMDISGNLVAEHDGEPNDLRLRVTVEDENTL